jgi:hypothetical protein
MSYHDDIQEAVTLLETTRSTIMVENATSHEGYYSDHRIALRKAQRLLIRAQHHILRPE